MHVTDDLAESGSLLNPDLSIKFVGDFVLSENLWFALNPDLLTVGSCECPLFVT